MSHRLGEFVLQICILGLPVRPSRIVGASLPQWPQSAVEHISLIARRHVASVNLFREMAGDRRVLQRSRLGRYASVRQRSSWFPALGIRKSWRAGGAATVALWGYAASYRSGLSYFQVRGWTTSRRMRIRPNQLRGEPGPHLFCLRKETWLVHREWSRLELPLL